MLRIFDDEEIVHVEGENITYIYEFKVLHFIFKKLILLKLIKRIVLMVGMKLGKCPGLGIRRPYNATLTSIYFGT